MADLRESFFRYTLNSGHLSTCAILLMHCIMGLQLALLDDFSVWIHLALRKYDQASELAQQAMALGPSNIFVTADASYVALFFNRPNEMVALLDKAMRL